VTVLYLLFKGVGEACSDLELSFDCVGLKNDVWLYSFRDLRVFRDTTVMKSERNED
jgi:hypothetical protein